MKKYYVYKITNKINNKYYIGVHKTDNINDGYYGSGRAIKAAISKHGKESFTKEVIGVFDDSEEAYLLEQELVDPTDPMSYNMNSGGKGGWDYVNMLGLPNPMTNEDVVEKNKNSNKSYRQSEKAKRISKENLKKAVQWNKTHERSEEHCQKLSASLKKYYQHNDHARKGHPLSENHKTNISNSWSNERKSKQSIKMKELKKTNPNCRAPNEGKMFSDKTKARMSESAKKSWQNRDNIICPHCGKSSRNSANMKRWHFENCKELK